MSRIFLILSLPHPGSHGKPSVGLQTRIAENDMYGAFSINSLAPSAREDHKRNNPGPTQDRFGFQVRTYKSSTSLALIINTSQHIPYVCWSSDTGGNDKNEDLIKELEEKEKGHRKRRKKHRHHRSDSQAYERAYAEPAYAEDAAYADAGVYDDHGPPHERAYE